MTEAGTYGDDRTTDGTLRVDLDTTSSPSESTARVEEAIRWAEGRTPPVVLAFRLGELEGPHQRSWPPQPVAGVDKWERAVRKLERTEAVVVVAATGLCGGAAFDIMLAADYRVAGTDMRLLLPVNDGHMWPGAGVHRLVQQVGLARARQLVLWGHELSASRAAELGLVDEVTADVPGTLSAAALLLGRASGPEHALRRQLMEEAASSTYEEALGAHLVAMDRETRRLVMVNRESER